MCYGMRIENMASVISLVLSSIILGILYKNMIAWEDILDLPDITKQQQRVCSKGIPSCIFCSRILAYCF